ncbi:hypothetical protein COT50_01120 [candidate division WWE3 bacterium CG08_land_8_20_14_0_20_41_10]|uniref:DUF86 domain-containing protein n=1 Tax=candidate division WWE3 bacterium CG08_land_8_20_14_0_20_41_10 TaxID=1975085 RepID=A0A2H0XEP2_UNCKA|nr:MAG: hypothetical protein COT50_01120 [candidate division WWE3 bacterium CG08_land_8_20_14_0_20_41_10]
MTKDNLLYIKDIQNSLEWILNVYLLNVDYIDFVNDNKTQDAVIRQMEIIGEAMNRLSDDFLLEHGELPFREAISMRNFLIHEYNMVDIDELWKTIHNDLPTLSIIVNKILAKHTDDK